MTEHADSVPYSGPPSISAVVIGRNEGQRLIACLDSLHGQFEQVIYVDSGSTDGSQEAARQRGVKVETLDMLLPFTAARARNVGLDCLRAMNTPVDLVQFLDGDCTLQPGWIDAAHSFLLTHPDVAVVCGRRRERYPDATIWNRMIDSEWDTPVGEALACGGDALMRMDALNEVGGYNPALIAGEEPELCLRLRRKGWKIWRIDAEMTLHDAAMTRFSQWWQRTRRAGYTYAEGMAMYGSAPERHNLRGLTSVLGRGLVLPTILMLGTLVLTPWMLLGLLIYPLQMLRLRLKGYQWASAIFLTLGRFPEAQGVLTYVWRRLIRKNAQLIEYK